MREKSSEPNASEDLFEVVLIMNQGQQLGEVVQLCLVHIFNSYLECDPLCLVEEVFERESVETENCIFD